MWKIFSDLHCYRYADHIDAADKDDFEGASKAFFKKSLRPINKKRLTLLSQPRYFKFN